ncbi:hypothetical protein [Streptomyces sp. NPDC026673]|uniref:hypothetical protein n=1 Tax=Streptomyces sp. NPDC026673 TaxID=3155724 RepID=UPI0034010B9F
MADAGWSAEEVCAWLYLRGEPARVRRPSGLLATLLAGAEMILDSPAKRDGAVDQAQAGVEAARRHGIMRERDRHERHYGNWLMPRSNAVRRLVAAAVLAPSAAAGEPDALPARRGPQDLTAVELRGLRREARTNFLAGDVSLVASAVRELGQEAAEGLYGAELVHRVLQVGRGTALMVLSPPRSRR